MNNTKPPVAILCGGQGTRLREETENRPKPLVQVGDWPILLHIMRHYIVYGLDDFILCTGYKGHMIVDYVSKVDQHTGISRIMHDNNTTTVTYSETPFPKFTADCIDTGNDTLTGDRIVKSLDAREIITHLDGDLLVTYGDGVANVNIDELLNFHKDSNRSATITVCKQKSRYGEVEIDNAGIVKKFLEKPDGSTWINCGYMVLSPAFIDRMKQFTNFGIEDALIAAAKENELAAFKHTGCFYSMDTYRDWIALNKIWKETKEWKTW